MNVLDLRHADIIDTLKSMPDNSVRLFLQDLPFGMTQSKWDKTIDLSLLWPEMLRVGVDNAAFIFFAQKPFSCDVIASNRKLYKYDIIWHKTSAKGYLNAKKMPLRAHEEILVFYKKMPVYNPQKTTGHIRKVSNKKVSKTTVYGAHGEAAYDSTERYPVSVLKFPSDTQKSALHPNQKPVALLRWFIRTYSNVGDVVFDGVAGSASTFIAGALEGRSVIGCDNDLDNYQIGKQRIIEHQKSAA